MAKNFSYASHRDNLCAASQNCYTPLPHDIVVLSFSFQYLPENYTGNGRGGSSSYVFRFFGFKPDILRAVAEQGYREPTLFSSRRSLRCWKAAT